MVDQRGFLKLAHGFPEHPKVDAAGGDAAWLYICALAYCARNTTDGLIPVGIIGRLSDRENPHDLSSKLVEVGLWHSASNTCERCGEVPPGKFLVHDYLDHQQSAEKVREVSEKRAIAGQKGGRAKAAAQGAASNLPSNLPSKSLAEQEQEQEQEQDKTTPSSSAAPSDPNDRPDIDALCNRLAQLMIANECKPPKITKRWRDETRRMLDIDGRGFDKAMGLLAWSQSHRHWKTRIQSMPKFREFYDPMRMQANEEWERAQRGAPTYGRPSTTELRTQQGLELVRELAEEDGVDLADLLPNARRGLTA